MTTVVYRGSFSPVTANDLALLDDASIWKDPRIPNWKNEDGRFLFPTIRDSMADGSLVVAVGEDGVVYAYGSGMLPPPPDRGGKLYELTNMSPADADQFRMKLFEPETGAATSVPVNLTRLPKADLWRRLTDAESAALDAALATAPIRLRRIYEAAAYLDTTDADYPALRSVIVAALGPPRAAEILAPTI